MTPRPTIPDGDALVLALEQEDRTEGRPDELYEAAELRLYINAMMEQMRPREKQALFLRFGLCKEGEKTLRQVGDIMDVGPERVRQIEAKVLRKLRHPHFSKVLRQYASPEPAPPPKPEPEPKEDYKCIVPGCGRERMRGSSRWCHSCGQYCCTRCGERQWMRDANQEPDECECGHDMFVRLGAATVKDYARWDRYGRTGAYRREVAAVGAF